MLSVPLVAQFVARKQQGFVVNHVELVQDDVKTLKASCQGAFWMQNLQILRDWKNRKPGNNCEVKLAWLIIILVQST